MKLKILFLKIITVLFYVVFSSYKSYATLSKEELQRIYSQPWIELAIIIAEDIEIIKPSDDYYSLNDAVQITHFRPPEQRVFNFFRKEVRQVDYIFFQHDPRIYNDGMGPNYKLSFFILHFTDGSHIAIMPKRIMREGPNRFADQMLHLMIATNSEFTTSHSFSEVDPLTSNRKANDFSFLATGNYQKKNIKLSYSHDDHNIPDNNFNNSVRPSVSKEGSKRNFSHFSRLCCRG